MEIVRIANVCVQRMSQIVIRPQAGNQRLLTVVESSHQIAWKVIVSNVVNPDHLSLTIIWPFADGINFKRALYFVFCTL
jgi:hypothetical protein